MIIPRTLPLLGLAFAVPLFFLLFTMRAAPVHASTMAFVSSRLVEPPDPPNVKRNTCLGYVFMPSAYLGTRFGAVCYSVPHEDLATCLDNPRTSVCASHCSGIDLFFHARRRLFHSYLPFRFLSRSGIPCSGSASYRWFVSCPLSFHCSFSWTPMHVIRVCPQHSLPHASHQPPSDGFCFYHTLLRRPHRTWLISSPASPCYEDSYCIDLFPTVSRLNRACYSHDLPCSRCPITSCARFGSGPLLTPSR